MTRTLVARQDNMGDVLLAGPAIRAAARDGPVTLLCGRNGAEAGKLLPGVADMIVWDAPWVGFDSPPVDRTCTEALVQEISQRRFERAAILTSFHQSPLPLALLLRMAGVPEIAAVGVDYPGSLLDHRVPYSEWMHEVEQNLAVVASLGSPGETDDRLRVMLDPDIPVPGRPYVVIHQGASVPARAIPPVLAEQTIHALSKQGIRVVLTGNERERASRNLTPSQGAVDLRGETNLSELGAIIAGGEVLIVGNSGPAHLAAALGTKVVSLFAPVVPLHRWRPWGVPTEVLGIQSVECAGCGSRVCSLTTQECVSTVGAEDVVAAVETLVPGLIQVASA